MIHGAAAASKGFQKKASTVSRISWEKAYPDPLPVRGLVHLTTVSFA